MLGGIGVAITKRARPDAALLEYLSWLMSLEAQVYLDFSRVNPRIIYCSGSGYGESGPYVTRPGQDMFIQGLTGVAAATDRGDGPPVPVGPGFSDQIGAMNMVCGILTARYWRERSGEGQEIRVDLLLGMLAHQGQEMLMAIIFSATSIARILASAVPVWNRRSASIRRRMVG